MSEVRYIITHEGLGPCPYQIGDRTAEPVVGIVQRIKTFEHGAGGVGTYEMDILIEDTGDQCESCQQQALDIQSLQANCQALFNRLAEMEMRLRAVEGENTIVGTIQGLDDMPITVTMPPEFWDD